MGKTKIDKIILLEFIIQNISDHPKDIVAFTAAEFKISRQTVYRYIKELVNLEIVDTRGDKRIQEYLLKSKEEIFNLVIDGSWDEETVWQQQVRSLIVDLPQNVFEICHYGITEMINNVLEHSGASNMQVIFTSNALELDFLIKDNGIGIFTKIQKDFNLSDKRHAILELAKGKLTSDPDNHTGEGIFFTSRAFDKFMIASQDLVYIGIDNMDVLFPDRESYVEGTLVCMTINKKSKTLINEVFDQFTPDIDNEDFGFKKTIVPVKLLQYEGDSLVSRSQAKRLIARFDHFREVVLDFQGVSSIGQSFADEVFRVFRKNYPDTHLYTININEDIDKMIKHVTANK